MSTVSPITKTAVCLTLAFATMFSGTLRAQGPDKSALKGNPVKGNTTSTPDPTFPIQSALPASSTQNSTAAQSSLAKLAATVTTLAPEPQGDYIPCKFTVAELRALVSPDIAPILTAFDAELLKQRVVSAATSGINDRSLHTTDLNEFINLLAEDNLDGLTPAQALNRIIHDLASSRGLTTKAAMSEIQPMDTSTIVDAARNTIALLERPPDVGCAMSILAYKETDQAYGHLIANNYIAVQVVVRNLNRDQAFVLHDVEFGVNADSTGRLGRFFSGRDKVIVRSLSAAQSSFDPRAIFVHSAQGVGAILSAAVPIFAVTALTDATAVFNGAFVPGLDKYWKDQTADQLNLLNDTGFSPQASSQTAVPVSGTLMFVTFIPSKPFEEGWWTQQCAEKTYLGTTDNRGFVSNLALGDNQQKSTSVGSGWSQSETSQRSHNEQTGVDVARALEICLLPNDPLPRKDRNGKGDYAIVEVPSQNSETNQAPHLPNVDLFRNAYPRPYKKWSPNSFAIFRELSNVVVSGTHIIEGSQLAASVSAMSCSTDETGNLIFPKPEKETVSCPVTGKNLDKVAKLGLRDPKNENTATAEGTLVPASGDSSNGSVSFQTAALHSLPLVAYSVFAVSINGVEQKTSQTIHLSIEPYVSSVAPRAVDFSTVSAGSQSLTISGNHLASVDTVSLANSDGSKNVQILLKVGALKTDTKLLVPLDPKTLTDFGPIRTTFTITLGVGAKNYETGQQFDFTGAATATKAKPTTPKPTTPKPTPPTTGPGGAPAH